VRTGAGVRTGTDVGILVLTGADVRIGAEVGDATGLGDCTGVLVIIWVGPFDGAEDVGLGVGSTEGSEETTAEGVSVGGLDSGEPVVGNWVGGDGGLVSIATGPNVRSVFGLVFQ
jgi:hypothetical protein